MLSKKLAAEFELEVRNLYLFEGHKPARIAEILEEDVTSVQSVVSRLGLAKLRKAARSEALANSADLLVQHQQRVTEVIAAQSETHAIAALRKTGDALNADNARDAASYSSTARNLVGIAQAVTGKAQGVTAQQVNLFFVSGAAPRLAGSELLD